MTEASRRKSAMGRPAAPSSAAAAVFKRAPAAYTKRLTLDLTAEDHRTLKLAALDTDAPMTDLLRGFIALVRSRPELAAEAASAVNPNL